LNFYYISKKKTAVKYFVSYSRNDGEFVKQLVHDLKKLNLNVWLDQMDIPVGAKWDTCIENALHESAGVILVLSKSSVKSENVMDEVNFAITKNKHIIPAVTDDCDVPFRLARIQQVSFRGNYNTGLRDIIETIRARQNATSPTHAKVSSKSDIRSAKTDAGTPYHNELTFAQAIKENKEAPAPYGPASAAKLDKPYVKPDKKIDSVPDEIITDPPKATAIPKAADTVKKSVARAVHAEDHEKKGKTIYVVVVAAVVLFFALWLFMTSSGREFYSSLSASLSDPDSMHEILSILFAGAVIGWVTGMIVDSDRQNIWIDVLLGVAGGFITYKLIFHGVWKLTAKNAFVNIAVTGGIGAVVVTAAVNAIKNMLLYRK
jgi:uncharacterized membrane protein YeaQ/YmgE (transglycosylase-associated protein family)